MAVQFASNSYTRFDQAFGDILLQEDFPWADFRHLLEVTDCYRQLLDLFILLLYTFRVWYRILGVVVYPERSTHSLYERCDGAQSSDYL